MVGLAKLSLFEQSQYSRVNASNEAKIAQKMDAPVEGVTKLQQASELEALNRRLNQMVAVADAHDARFDAITAKLNQLLSVAGGDPETARVGSAIGVGQLSLNMSGAPLAVARKNGNDFAIELNLMELLKTLVVGYAAIKGAEYLFKKYVKE